VERRGHTILDAGFTALEAGAVADDGTQVLPSIADATRVWVTGTSAGSMGAQMHLDHIAARLPGVDVRGGFDAAVRPDPSTVPAPVAVGVDAVLVDRYAQRIAEESPPPFLDASCAAGTELADQWQCAASAYLPYRWVETPFFAKMDLFDSSASDDYIAAGASKEEFAEAVYASLSLLASLQVGGVAPGVFGPACSQHVGFEEDWWFFQQSISDGAVPVTLHDALVQSLEGVPVELLDRDRTLSRCE
jgi:hypothetical protein